jgi:hypothetical protein
MNWVKYCVKFILPLHKSFESRNWSCHLNRYNLNKSIKSITPISVLKIKLYLQLCICNKASCTKQPIIISMHTVSLHLSNIEIINLWKKAIVFLVALVCTEFGLQDRRISLFFFLKKIKIERRARPGSFMEGTSHLIKKKIQLGVVFCICSQFMHAVFFWQRFH